MMLPGKASLVQREVAPPQGGDGGIVIAVILQSLSHLLVPRKCQPPLHKGAFLLKVYLEGHRFPGH